ncbi:MAG: PAS domain S-box protein [Geobacteraceae bacterium]|nr:PAS domain S-box protein [Geobacteraceae bacterium]
MKSVFVVEDNGRGMEEIRAFLRERGYGVTEYTREYGEELRFACFAIDRASLQVFWLTPDQRILYANDAACRALGYSREELTRMSVRDIDPGYHGLNEPERSGIWKRFRETGYGRFETNHRARDGRVYPVEVRCNFLEFEGREYSCCFVADISERNTAQEALLESETKFRLLIETSPNAIIVIRGDRIVYANQAATRVSGFTSEQLMNMDFWNFVHEDFRETARERILARLRGEPLSAGFEYRLVGSRGEDKWVVAASVSMNFEGAPGILVTFADITETKRTQEALRESEARLRLAMDVAKVVPWEFDGESGMFRFDDQFYALYGTSAEREGGTFMSADSYVRRFVHPEDMADVIDVMERSLSNRDGTSIGGMEHRIIRADGEERHISVRFDVIRDREGRVVRARGANQDITERKRAEGERKSLEAQLHQFQKMEAIGQLAGGIAHDFNNILTAILGFAEVVALRMEEGNPLLRHVRQIQAAAERAVDLTRGLLAFSRKQVLHTRVLDLHEIIDGVKKMLRRVIPEDIDFRVKAAARGITVLADRGQIEQVLMNLVTNARDAMPSGGVLTLESGAGSIDDEFVKRNGLGRPGRYARIVVRDTGCGMDEETREKIFEPFFTTKGVGKGTGLGLSITYGIVKQHDGFITVDSSPGQGTVFSVYLPRAESEKQTLPGTARAENAPGGAETILLVEDDDMVRELNREILEQAGYAVIETVDGREALERFRERPERIDILVTDVIMPTMGGKKLYEEILGMRPDIKVLFMSGYATDTLDARGVLDNGYDFVAKPVVPSEFLKRVREILDRG